MMAAYERMFGGGSVEVAILRMLGLFDRPADEGEIAALRAEPMVPGLTDEVVGIGVKDWNRAVAKLRRVGLVAATEGAQDRRLDAHPLVREHFGDEVRQKQAEAWREGHRRLYEHLKEMAKELSERSRRWRRSTRRWCMDAGRGRIRKRSTTSSGSGSIEGTRASV